MSISYFQSGTILPTERLALSRSKKQHKNKARSLDITEIKLHELKANIKLARPPFIKKVTNPIHAGISKTRSGRGRAEYAPSP